MKLDLKRRKILAQALVKELSLYSKARIKGDERLCYDHLGRAHIISQYRWFHHFYVHFLMFEYSWKKRDRKEILGQLVRMMATIPGHMFKKLPKGNIGWITVGLREELPLPDDLRVLLD